MELMSTIATLDSYYLIMDEEIKEITKDLVYLKELTKRYGPHWAGAQKQLKMMKVQREHSKKEITMKLDLFKLHLPAAKLLCKKLQRDGPDLRFVEKPREDYLDFTLTVASPILRNSTANLPNSVGSDANAVRLFPLPDPQPRTVSPSRSRS
ncbi:hypothetical protein DIPPA_10520 [Diplonema papillatum]|nr:hypothetical protein DIPPA_10520 [Diplonema papillatum]